MIRNASLLLLCVPVVLQAQATPPTLGANRNGRLSERARQDREIV